MNIQLIAWCFSVHFPGLEDKSKISSNTFGVSPLTVVCLVKLFRLEKFEGGPRHYKGEAGKVLEKVTLLCPLTELSQSL